MPDPGFSRRRSKSTLHLEGSGGTENFSRSQKLARDKLRQRRPDSAQETALAKSPMRMGSERNLTDEPHIVQLSPIGKVIFMLLIEHLAEVITR